MARYENDTCVAAVFERADDRMKRSHFVYKRRFSFSKTDFRVQNWRFVFKHLHLRFQTCTSSFKLASRISIQHFNMSEDGSSIKMDATINFVPDQDETLFFYNPVLRTDSGQVFAIPGDFMAVSSAMNPPGSSVGQTVRDERKHTENGSEITDTTTVSIQIKAVREPLKIRLLQFSEAHELLKSEEFEPGTVPEQIVPLTETDYLLLETVEKDPEGSSFTRREAIGRDVDFLNTMSCRDDGICLCHYHEVLWEAIVPEENAVKETVTGNMISGRLQWVFMPLGVRGSVHLSGFNFRFSGSSIKNDESQNRKNFCTSLSLPRMTTWSLDLN